MNLKQWNELHILATGLPRVRPERFNMAFWGDRSFNTAIDEVCGFAGCAIGWAPTIIPDCGLRLVISPGDALRMTPTYRDRVGIFAVMDYFGLELHETQRLFIGGPHNDTPSQVSENILKFLEQNLPDAEASVANDGGTGQ